VPNATYQYKKIEDKINGMCMLDVICSIHFSFLRASSNVIFFVFNSTLFLQYNLSRIKYTAIRTKHRQRNIIHNMCSHLVRRTTRYTKKCLDKNHALILQNFTHCAQNISFLYNQSLVHFLCGCSLAALNYRS
jgi:hypothetical protein